MKKLTVEFKDIEDVEKTINTLYLTLGAIIDYYAEQEGDTRFEEFVESVINYAIFLDNLGDEEDEFGEI